MEYNRFIALFGFVHLVDQTDEAVDKYSVTSMSGFFVPYFCQDFDKRYCFCLSGSVALGYRRIQFCFGHDFVRCLK